MRNLKADKLKKERTGAKRTNRYGTEATVINYGGYKDVLVEFSNGGTAKTRWADFDKGQIVSPYDKTVEGIGYIGEGKFTASADRKLTTAYKKWSSMFTRCYREKYRKYNATYTDVKICEDWHNFQNFASWHEDNYYTLGEEEMQLDKDILFKGKGSKIYSPENCVYVPKRINSLFATNKASRGDLPIGVTFTKEKVYRASLQRKGCNSRFLGDYKTPEEAFKRYKIEKEKVIKEVAEEYRDFIPIKLYNALINFKINIDD